MLEAFSKEIWIASGEPITAIAGFHYPTRMAAIRLKNGELLIWSPVTLTSQIKEETDRLGKVRYLISPNALHHMFISEWKEAYPDARIFAAPGLQKKRKDLPIEVELHDNTDTSWKDELDFVLMHGNLILKEAVFFHMASKTVIFTDLLKQMPAGWYSGWRAVVAKLDLMTEAVPTVPRKFRLSFHDRKSARKSLDHILKWPVEKVLMAHGTPITREGHAFLKSAFTWLK